MGRIYVGDGNSFVWQWQPKEHIVLEGYPEGVFVHYANCDTVEAPVVQSRMEGDKLVASIPPELMQVDKDITVYVCDVDGTKHCHFLSVLSRPKPESYVTEPVEVLRYESLAERVTALEKGGNGGGGPAYIASEEPPENTKALWVDTTPPGEAVALGVTAVETDEGVDLYCTDELGTVKVTARHGKDGEPGAPGEKGDPGTDGREIEVGYDHSYEDGGTNYVRFRYRGDTTWRVYPILNGKKGEPGADGITPYIGDNGNWWAGDSDTGKPSRGPAGPEYELTEDDRQDIAGAVLDALPRWTGGAY